MNSFFAEIKNYIYLSEIWQKWINFPITYFILINYSSYYKYSVGDNERQIRFPVKIIFHYDEHYIRGGGGDFSNIIFIANNIY